MSGETKDILINVKCQNIIHLEHVLVTVTIEAPKRGDVEVVLKSPSGKDNMYLH